MTTVVMVQQADDVLLGWDSQLTRGNEAANLVCPKVFVQGDYVLAVSGALRAIDVIETLELPVYPGGVDKRHWLIKYFVPVIQEAAEKYDLIDKERNGWEFGLLLVLDGQAFTFDGAGSVYQTLDGIYTDGSGSDYAKGALLASRFDQLGRGNGPVSLTTGDILLALRVASEVDPFTGGPLFAGGAREYLAGTKK